jgi:PilZ domain-containing protein
MERRLDERYQANLDVTVTDIAAPHRIAWGRIVDISQSGVCANLSSEFALGAVVKAQLADCVLFGHVIDCARIEDNEIDANEIGAYEPHANQPGANPAASHSDQSFRTGIEVVRVLIGESDLGRLVNAILAEKMPATPGVRAIPTP